MPYTTTNAAGNWNDALIWTNGVPTTGVDATVNHNVTINANAAFGNIDNNATLLFGGNYVMTIDDGCTIDNVGGTINANNNSITLNASAGVTKWYWKIDSGTWTDGTGVHDFADGSLNIAANYAGFNSGTYTFSEDMKFDNQGGNYYYTFGTATVINFASAKTYTLGNTNTYLYLDFQGTVNMPGTSGNHITFVATGDKGYMRFTGGASGLLRANISYVDITDGYFMFYITAFNSTAGDIITMNACSASLGDTGLYIADGIVGTLTLSGFTGFSNADGIKTAALTAGTLNLNDCITYSNTSDGVDSQTSAAATFNCNRLKSYANASRGYRTGSGQQKIHTLRSSLLYENAIGVDMMNTSTGSEIFNVTSVFNGASYQDIGVSIANFNSCPITNSIFGGAKYGINSVGTDDPVVTYCDATGAITANYFGMTDPTGTTGNISVNPQFTNVATDDYTILASSPCVNTGIGVGAPATDLTNTVWSNANPEIGCYTVAGILRYFIAGGTDRLWTSTLNWSSSSGGAGGSSVPVTTNAVYFDASSPDCTVNATSTCNSLDFTGYTGIFDQNANMYIHGGVNFVSGMTLDNDGYTTILMSTANITSNTLEFYNLDISSNITMSDSLHVNNNLLINSGASLNAASKTITLSKDIDISGGFNHGSGWVIFDGLTHNITGSTTFYNFSAVNTNATLNFNAGDTFAVSNILDLEGTAADGRLTIKSQLPGTAWKLDWAGSSYTVNYVHVFDSNASDGNEIIAYIGTNYDGGGNTNWAFTAPVVTGIDSEGIIGGGFMNLIENVW